MSRRKPHVDVVVLVLRLCNGIKRQPTTSTLQHPHRRAAHRAAQYTFAHTTPSCKIATSSTTTHVDNHLFLLFCSLDFLVPSPIYISISLRSYASFPTPLVPRTPKTNATFYKLQVCECCNLPHRWARRARSPLRASQGNRMIDTSSKQVLRCQPKPT